MKREKKFKSFSEFWPFYLSVHKSTLTKNLHAFGFMSGLVFLFFAIWMQKWILILYGTIFAYFMGWLGHYFVEKNHPATFKNPIYSFMADMKMIYLVVRGKI